MSHLPKMVSYFDKGLSISLEIPAEWQVHHDEDFPLSLLAKPVKGYQANMTFSHMGIESPRIEVLQEAIAETKQEQTADYPSFRQLKEEQVWQDDCPAYVQLYEWQAPEVEEKFEQMLAMILTPEHGLFAIYGTTLQSLRADYLPIFEHVIGSMRFIAR